MRVSAVRRARRSAIDARGEQGIVSLMVGVSVIALFGSAAVAVDLGNLWSTRRHIITATDAAALGAASEYAVGGHGCGLAAGQVADNDDAADLTGCDPTLIGPASGYVEVSAHTPVDYAFAPVIGVADRTVSSSTTAAWGLPTGMNGLRPFGICRDDPSFRAWLVDPSGESPVARVLYTHDGTNCGSAPGNWAIIDLDNSGNVSNSDTKRWVHQGYSGLVRPGNIVGTPGAISNTLAADLAAVQFKRFPIPVFDRVMGEGSNAKFHVIGFVGVQLHGWNTTGAESARYLDVKFIEMVGSGECCENRGTDFGLRVVHICDVDGRFNASECA